VIVIRSADLHKISIRKRQRKKGGREFEVNPVRNPGITDVKVRSTVREEKDSGRG